MSDTTDYRERPGYRHVRPVRDLVTDEEAHEAMQFLDTIPHAAAVAKAEWEYLDSMTSVTEAVGAQFSDERAVDKRKWDAKTSRAYTDNLAAVKKARIIQLEIEGKREAARIKIEVWRTIHADKRERGVAEPGRRTDERR
jgi:hypothetical protein